MRKLDKGLAENNCFDFCRDQRKYVDLRTQQKQIELHIILDIRFSNFTNNSGNNFIVYNC